MSSFAFRHRPADDFFVYEDLRHGYLAYYAARSSIDDCESRWRQGHSDPVLDLSRPTSLVKPVIASIFGSVRTFDLSKEGLAAHLTLSKDFVRAPDV